MSNNYGEEKIPTIGIIKERMNEQYFDSKRGRVTIADCLQVALKNVEESGYLLTLPELVSIKTLDSTQQHQYWNNIICAYTEENKGIDTYGQIYPKGTEVVTIVHGGGLLTPERISEALEQGLVRGNVKYTQEEFDMLLSGQNALGNHISMYAYHNLYQKDVIIPNRQFGIVIPYELVERTQAPFWNAYAMESNPSLVIDYQKDSSTSNRYSASVFWDEYMIRSNPLANARVGNSQLLLAYHDMAKNEFGDLGCSHRFRRAHADEPQGYLVALGENSSGMYGVRADQQVNFAAYSTKEVCNSYSTD